MFGNWSHFTALYHAAKSGRDGAAEELLHHFQIELGAYIRPRLGARARGAWEDIRQETLITVLGRLPAYPDHLGEDAFRAYLFQTAKRKISTYLRRPNRVLQGEAGGAPVQATIATGMGPATQAGMRDEIRRVRALILGLRSSYAGVLRCIVLESRSIRDTALALGLSEDAVKKRYYRASIELRRLLGGDEQGPVACA
jgi:RNA polymerase sigma factor (sigma-70 family)